MPNRFWFAKRAGECWGRDMRVASELFAFPASLPFGGYFAGNAAPWEWVPAIRRALDDYDFPEFDRKLPPGLHVDGPVVIDASVKLPAYGSIQGPAFIGAECELRPGVFIRGRVIAGKGCVLGNSCEFKNCLLLDGVQVPHFSYVGDSVLGNGAHLGAGVICSNLRLDQKEIAVRLADGARQNTGMRKLGALVGDRAEVGCNAVLNPGTILGQRALVMPALSFGGTLSAASVAYAGTTVATVPRAD